MAVCAVVTTVLIAPALALNYGSGTYGTCQYDSCGITVSSSSNISVNVTPSSGGTCTVQKDTVSVFTDDSSGYLLSFTGSSSNTSLIKGADSIPATSGTQASPIALAANKWGYRVDGIGGFGAGPTAAQTNSSLGATLFAAVPASTDFPDTLASSSTPADPAVDTSVWYGVCANTSTTSGVYTSTVTYTAVAN